jgi:hypothetical protein
VAVLRVGSIRQVEGFDTDLDIAGDGAIHAIASSVRKFAQAGAPVNA